jgi:PleD family two-component response regulator
LGYEILVPLFVVILSQAILNGHALCVADLRKLPLMMILHHSAIPAVVLVVEDEMLLRMRAVDMVEDAGFTSIEAVDADQAVAILESRSDIALLFTDIQMPGSLHMPCTSAGRRSRSSWYPGS